MKVAILDKVIRRNIALFKHLMRRQAQRTQREQEIVERVIQAYVDCENGTIHFPELEAQIDKKWKQVSLQLMTNEEGQVQVVMQGTDGGKDFKCGDFDPEAFQALGATMKVLNRILYNPMPRQTIEQRVHAAFRQIIQLDLELTQIEQGRSSLIEEAWVDVDREGAEALLAGKPDGTYLLRRSGWASLMEKNLNEVQPEPIKCMTLTFTEKGGKIAEHLIVFKNGKWLFFNDDLELKGKTYATLKDLLASLGSLLKTPLAKF